MSISREEISKLEPITPEDDKRLIKEGKRERYEENKEENREYARKHAREHRSEWEEYNRTHRKRNLILGAFGEEGFSIYLLQNVNTNGKVIGVGSFSGSRSPEENRLSARKHNLKGATVLNEWFPESEIHHMSEDVVIFIPKELHRSVWHNLGTGEGMEEINGKALVWAGRQSNE